MECTVHSTGTAAWRTTRVATRSYEELVRRLASEQARIDPERRCERMNQHKTHREPLGPAASALELSIRVCYC